ncbi:MAG TPA: hypothetical protein VK871_13455 [Candidatus Limnocylindrales bacterium]|nr:hypothetical protein [Candidatus Limnocylindrales bacterium]
MATDGEGEGAAGAADDRGEGDGSAQAASAAAADHARKPRRVSDIESDAAWLERGSSVSMAARAA